MSYLSWGASCLRWSDGPTWRLEITWTERGAGTFCPCDLLFNLYKVVRKRQIHSLVDILPILVQTLPDRYRLLEFRKQNSSPSRWLISRRRLSDLPLKVFVLEVLNLLRGVNYLVFKRWEWICLKFRQKFNSVITPLRGRSPNQIFISSDRCDSKRWLLRERLVQIDVKRFLFAIDQRIYAGCRCPNFLLEITDFDSSVYLLCWRRLWGLSLIFLQIGLRWAINPITKKLCLFRKLFSLLDTCVEVRFSFEVSTLLWRNHYEGELAGQNWYVLYPVVKRVYLILKYWYLYFVGFGVLNPRY